MRILHLAFRDTAGVPGRWAAAHRQAGHETELLVEFTHPFSYGAEETVWRWSAGTQSGEERASMLPTLLSWADAVMAYDHPFYLDAAIASGKPVLFRALGQSSREFAQEIIALLRAPNVVRATAGTADLALLLGVELVGAPYPLLEPAEPEGLVLCHAPSDRAAKGTERILRAAQETGWEVDLLEGMTNADVLAHKHRCALVVDTCGPDAIPDGYGVNAVEAMAMGLPVVASASPRVARMLTEIDTPVLAAQDESELTKTLGWLKDPTMRRQCGEAGRIFVARFHSAADRAHEDMFALSSTPVAA